MCSCSFSNITGRTSSFGTGDYDAWLLKTDAGGNRQWDKTFGGAAFDVGYSVSQTSDRGYIIADTTESYGAGSYDVWLIKVAKDNQPPNPPIIKGPTSGKTGTVYPYTFTSIDPNGDQVSYYIKWDDGSITDWTTFQASDPPGLSESHTWDEQGTYTIEAKAKDIYGAESERLGNTRRHHAKKQNNQYTIPKLSTESS